MISNVIKNISYIFHSNLSLIDRCNLVPSCTYKTHVCQLRLACDCLPTLKINRKIYAITILKWIM